MKASGVVVEEKLVCGMQLTLIFYGCLTNSLAPLPIALESCSTAQTDRPV